MKPKRLGPALVAGSLILGFASVAAAQEREMHRTPHDSMHHRMMDGMGMGMDCPMAGGRMGMGMGGMMGGMPPTPPPVKGFSEGKVAFFIHTEVSDRDIATLLTNMMGSPVLYVPALANVPEALLVPIYVFTNGIADGGPLGHQRDVVPSPPNWRETGGYSPLRRLHKVTWKNPANARVLKSDEEVQQARASGEITIERTNVVINAPMVKWPLGRR